MPRVFHSTVRACRAGNRARRSSLGNGLLDLGSVGLPSPPTSALITLGQDTRFDLGTLGNADYRVSTWESAAAVLVDGTALTDTHWWLVASVPCQGRAQIIVQEAHPKKRVATPQVQRRFLTSLSRIVPANCTPVVISDAGFMGPWFGCVRKLGWDFVGRLPSNVTITMPYKKERKVASLRPQRCDKPEHLGECAVTKSQPYQASVIIVRQRKKGVGRRRSRRCGAGMNSILHTRYKRRIRTTWALVTSLHKKSAAQIVALYKSRMQCEEAFRDAKNLKLGLGLSGSLSKDPKRLQVLALIVALANFVSTVLGRLAYSENLHRALQANTLTHRRVFSIPRLGALLFRLKLLRSITKRAWEQQLHAFQTDRLAS